MYWPRILNATYSVILTTHEDVFMEYVPNMDKCKCNRCQFCDTVTIYFQILWRHNRVFANFDLCSLFVCVPTTNVSWADTWFGDYDNCQNCGENGDNNNTTMIIFQCKTTKTMAFTSSSTTTTTTAAATKTMAMSTTKTAHRLQRAWGELSPLRPANLCKQTSVNPGIVFLCNLCM